MTGKNQERVEWMKMIGGWAAGILIATVPQILLFSNKFAVLYDRSDRVTADIKEIQEKGSDPVQVLTTTVALVRQEQNQFKEALLRFEKNQEAMLLIQGETLKKIDLHLSRDKP
jgi:hypothetical protein